MFESLPHRVCTMLMACLTAGCVSTLKPTATVQPEVAVNRTVPVLAPTLCDRLAASRIDPLRPEGVEPVSDQQLDAEQAIAACTADVAATQGHPRMLTQLARAHVKAEQAATAVELLHRAAAQGYPYANQVLGVLYQDGRQIPRDLQRAAYWYQQAGQAGMPQGWNQLGLLYDQEFPTRDREKALDMYLRAAKGGEPYGMLNAGLTLLNSDRSRDQREGLKWLERGAEQGNIDSMRRIGHHYWAQKAYHKALPWHQRAADAGDANAMHALGNYHMLGVGGVPKNPARALDYYEQSARGGFVPASMALAQDYASHRDVPRDLQKAREWMAFHQPSLSADAREAGPTQADTVMASAVSGGCGEPVATPAISAALAHAAGMRTTQEGYVLDIDTLVRRAGSPQALLAASREQIRTNMRWFDEMAPLATDVSSPLIADVHRTYQQAQETHEVELGIQRAAECLLGLPPTAAARPASLEQLVAQYRTRLAQEREAERQAEARAAAGNTFMNFLGTVGRALGAAGASMASQGGRQTYNNSDELAVGRSSR